MANVLTPLQRSRTSYSTFDVECRYFAYVGTYDDVDTTDYMRGAIPIGWLNTNVVGIAPPTGWTEVTDLIYFKTRVEQSWDDASIKWTATLHGKGYRDSYFGLNHPIVCLVRFYDYVKLTGFLSWAVGFWRWSAWELDWIGQITEGDYSNDYREGDEWTRTVGGADTTLRKRDTKRVVVAPTNLSEGASVTVSNTLASASDEVGYGEFIGSSANVDGANIVDGNINTVWISQGVPSLTGETPAATEFMGIDEVFFKPQVGWNVDETWWFELYANHVVFDSGQNYWDLGADGYGSYSNFNHTGVWIESGIPGVPSSVRTIKIKDDGGQFVLVNGERAIVCWDSNIFDRYTGGSIDAKFTIEARTFGTLEGPPFKLYPDLGYLKVWRGAEGDGDYSIDAVVWSPDGRHIKEDDGSWDGGAPTWPAIATVNVGSLTAGQSIRRSPTGTDTNTAADWQAESHPVPAGWDQPNEGEWALISLKDNACTVEDVSAGAASMVVSEINCWPDPSHVGGGYQGFGVIDSTDVFQYTSVDYANSTLNLVRTGQYAVGAHAGTVSCVPMYDSRLRTGWPITNITVKRRDGLSQIRKMRIYVTGNDTSDAPTEVGWQSTYDPQFIEIQNNAGVSSLTFNFALANLGFRWVRRILIVIDQMCMYRNIIGTATPTTTTLTLYPNTTGWDSSGIGTFDTGDNFVYTGKTSTTLTGVSDIGSTYPSWSRVRFDGGRAKINEVLVDLAFAAVNGDASATIGSLRSADLALNLLEDGVGFDANDFLDLTNAEDGIIGTHATAIAPYTDTLNDLARSTGCLVNYDFGGEVIWQADPWWPMGNRDDYPIYTFAPGCIRGTVTRQITRAEVDGIAINGRDAAGDESWRIEYGNTVAGAQIKEYDGYVAPQNWGYLIANMLMFQVTHQDRIRFTVKGVGDWCEPSQWIGLLYDLDGDGIAEYSGWVIERVSRTCDVDSDGKRSWKVDIEARAYNRVWGTTGCN